MERGAWAKGAHGASTTRPGAARFTGEAPRMSPAPLPAHRFAGHNTPRFFDVTGASPRYVNFCNRFPS